MPQVFNDYHPISQYPFSSLQLDHYFIFDYMAMAKLPGRGTCLVNQNDLVAGSPIAVPSVPQSRSSLVLW